MDEDEGLIKDLPSPTAHPTLIQEVEIEAMMLWVCSPNMKG